MMLAHAVLLAEARTHLGALADGAPSVDVALEYERVLLQLDDLHHGAVASDARLPSQDRKVLHAIAEMAICNLVAHGVDRLGVELCLAMLEAAWQLEVDR